MQCVHVIHQCMHGLLNVGRLPSYAAFGTSPRLTSRGPVGGPPVSFGRMSCRAQRRAFRDGSSMCGVQGKGSLSTRITCDTSSERVQLATLQWL